MATIQDFGNKIGGAAKDRAVARAPRHRTAGATPRASKPLRFELRYERRTGVAFFCKVGDKAYRRLREFATIAEARAFRDTPDFLPALTEAWQAARDRGNVTEDKLRGSVNKPRSGPDYRRGADVAPEVFLAAFRPYGVEFGNWQTDRAACLNQAYDALNDLSQFLRIPAGSICFGGTLGLAFGARGHGKAAAHYEPGRRVINLTKTAGAGCLAHEWFHAWDHARGVSEGLGGYASQCLSGDVRACLRALPTALKNRCIAADKTRSGRYFSLPEEVMARAFEAWVRATVENDYLANITPAAAFHCGPSRYPYPLADEMPAVDAAFRRLFALS